MKKRYALFAVVFAVSMLIGIQAVKLVGANPYGVNWDTEIPAPPSVKLDLKIASPIDGAVYTNGTLDVCFNVTLIDPNSLADSLYMSFYKGDWMKDAVWCPFMVKSNVWHSTDFLPFNFTIIEVPYGHHSLEISPTAQGTFIRNGTAYHFHLNKTISVNFFMRSNPVIAFLTNQNTTSTNSTFPVNFTIDHPVTEMAYRLDGQESVPITGNITLSDLPNGQHNVTVYATDEFGYTGKSNTLLFNVNSPEVGEFSLVPSVAPFTIAAIALTAAGLLVYSRRRKGKP
jgi:hypothetical protein